MTENLRPCPFCGKKGIILDPAGVNLPHDDYIGKDVVWYHAGCEDCDIWFADDEGTREGAIAKWNTRTDENNS